MTYRAVHQRLARERGPASERLCPCGEQAADWAYVGPREPGRRKPWSNNLRHYRALCRECHQAYDRAIIRAVERAQTSTLW